MGNKILVVDDSKTDVVMIMSILSNYELLVAYDGIEAMKIIEAEPEIELIILDLNMPRMNGFQVLEELQKKKEYEHIATLILTNYDETENEIRGLDLGAVDYIRKPLNFQSLQKRIEVHLHLQAAKKCLKENNIVLEKTVQERTKELKLTRDVTVNALIGLLEVRNIESSNHTKRTQLMMINLCQHLSKKDAYKDILTEAYIKELYDTAPLHDIGKVGIPDKILLKPEN